MITKIQGEQPFQVLTNNFSISPSQEGYTLQISADGKQFSNLFSVGAGVTRLVTGVAANSYYRLLGNESEVSVNWMKTCITEGGSGGSGATYTAGDYISIAEDVISVTGITPDLYLTSADTENYATKSYVDSADTIIYDSAATYIAAVENHLFDVEQVTASALTELHGGLLGVSGDVQTLSAATAGKADAASVSANTAVSRWPAWNEQGIITGTVSNAGFETKLQVNGSAWWFWQDGSGKMGPTIYAPTNAGTSGDILVSTGNGAPVWSAVTMGGNSNILAAISSLTEYAVISGSVKTGDLIQVQGVVLDGYDGPQYGLFEAAVEEEETDGVVNKIISWSRKDNSNSVFWSEDYPWMVENGIAPVDFFGGSFLIAVDELAAERGEDEAYNGIGFNADGKPVITHITPEYDDQTGEITGITREDRDILGELDTLDEAVSAALVDLNEKKVESQDVKHIVKLTQADYNDLVQYDDVDPYTFYIIINNNN